VGKPEHLVAAGLPSGVVGGCSDDLAGSDGYMFRLVLRSYVADMAAARFRRRRVPGLRRRARSQHFRAGYPYPTRHVCSTLGRSRQDVTTFCVIAGETSARVLISMGWNDTTAAIPAPHSPHARRQGAHDMDELGVDQVDALVAPLTHAVAVAEADGGS
jgi:hypothetical protein